MASTFKTAAAAILATRTDVYTAGAGITAVVHGIHVSNIDGTNAATVDIEFYDSSATTYFHLGKTLPVPAGSTMVFEKPVNLETGDKISITASAANDIEAVLSVLELS